jgi:hypothetical protein
VVSGRMAKGLVCCRCCLGRGERRHGPKRFPSIRKHLHLLGPPGLSWLAASFVCARVSSPWRMWFSIGDVLFSRKGNRI